MGGLVQNFNGLSGFESISDKRLPHSHFTNFVVSI
jgi:hypothetical protein